MRESYHSHLLRLATDQGLTTGQRLVALTDALLFQELGRKPTTKELAECVGMTPGSVRVLRSRIAAQGVNVCCPSVNTGSHFAAPILVVPEASKRATQSFKYITNTRERSDPPEGVNTRSHQTPPSTALSRLFSVWWDSVWRKVDRQQCERWWTRNFTRNPSAVKIFQANDPLWRTYYEMLKFRGEGKYAHNPINYLKSGRWEEPCDELHEKVEALKLAVRHAYSIDPENWFEVLHEGDQAFYLAAVIDKPIQDEVESYATADDRIHPRSAETQEPPRLSNKAG